MLDMPTDSARSLLAELGVPAAPTNRDNGQRKPTLELIRLSSVQSEKVRFLMEPYLPIGKITLMDGDPGSGKTTIALAIGAAVTKGKGAPNMAPRDPANVLLLSCEDGLSDTIRPRLEAMGADLDRVFSIHKPFSFDDAGLQGVILHLKEIHPLLVVVDPIQAYLGGKVNMSSANEVRPILAKLAALASYYDFALLIIRHLTKGGRDKALYRGLGSIDFAGAARSVLLVGSDQVDPCKRAIVHVKSNISPLGEPIGFELKQGQFYWTGRTHLTAGDLLAPENQEAASSLQDAKEFLADILKDGAVLQSEIEKQWAQSGGSKATLRRAKTAMGAKSKKNDFKGGWIWWLAEGAQPPEKHDEGAQVSMFAAQSRILSTFERERERVNS